jgi:uncharacterized membrane protein
MAGIGSVLVAAVAFVGTHFLLSHPLRKPLVGLMGEKGFAGLYSLIALGTFAWLVIAYRHAPAAPLLWGVGETMWVLVSAVMLLASILLMGSLIGNPAFPGGGHSVAAPLARGVFAVTRHPMLWAFALWGAGHIAIYPSAPNIVVAAAILVLSLLGAALLDRKKKALQPLFWPQWESQTSYFPFVAIAQRRARLGGFGLHALGGGLILWLLATWAHRPLSGWRAGIWHWIH